MADDVPVTNPVEPAPVIPVLPAAEHQDQPLEPGHHAVQPSAPESTESPAAVGLAEDTEETSPVTSEELPSGEAVEPAAEGAPLEAVATAEEPAEEPKPSNKHWYVVKVQSGREESIREAIERRVKIEGLEEYFGQIHIPTERVTEVRNSKRVTKERKLYPGYIMAEVEYNDRILYLFRETSGVGDFVGGTVTRPPTPMTPREIERMMGQKHDPAAAKVVTAKPKFDLGDRVKVTDGTFAGMEGEVKELLEAVSRVKVELTIFGRPVPVELEYWQVEQV